eukprot:2423176-Prymnesium_polylepis.1
MPTSTAASVAASVAPRLAAAAPAVRVRAVLGAAVRAPRRRRLQPPPRLLELLSRRVERRAHLAHLGLRLALHLAQPPLPPRAL